MKKIVLIIGLLLFNPLFLLAQARDYRVVFDLTSKDTVDQRSVIRWINEISNSTKDAKMEVVLYGKGLDLVVKDKSTMANDIEQLAKNKNVSFKACAIAMQNQKVDKTQLIPGVEIVPDGIYEIISKQRDGWGYIKATR
ncbi:DsrE family protein [Solitalea koreensis]|uniref:Uncharacterized protein n=1 Tax=Solitalea koreensis TaxID=543615 RepID=A0A521C211_9SPHI|nr:DsrE family protein [Solitalea koreensis]SMO53375.1 hypothetical protein SAMN06265350_103127 [Solitalea koreensis]